jgi:hypothetical protein
MKLTNFDRYVKEQLADPVFARRFKQAGQAWDVALQIAALRQRAGLSQKGVGATRQDFAAADLPPGVLPVMKAIP